MIKELNELTWYAQKSVWRDENLLEFMSGGCEEIMAMYKRVGKHHYKTDEEAAKGLGMGATAYKKYGRRLIRYLHDMVFFFNDEKADVDVTVKNIFNGAREMASVRMLAWRACRTAGKEAAERLLRRGQEYDWPEFVVEASLFLRDSVVWTGGKAREFERYTALYQEYKVYVDLERQSWEYYLRIKQAGMQKAVVCKSFSKQIEAYIAGLAPYVGKAPSYFFHLYYFVLKNHCFIQNVDYEQVLSNCDEALAYFKKKKYPVVYPLSVFYNYKVVAHTMLGQFEEGRDNAEASFKILEEGSVNWFNAMQTYVYLALHTGRFEEALYLYMRAATHRRLGALSPARQEIWQILGAYCFILHRLKDLALPNGFPVFKSRKFLNDLPTYSRDKNGMNIAILIAHVILQLLEGQDEAIWERILALEKYRARNLRNLEESNRSVLFIRILALLPRAQYCRKIFIQKAEQLLVRLRTMPLDLTKQAHELEVIPYETLTYLIADHLPIRRTVV